MQELQSVRMDTYPQGKPGIPLLIPTFVIAHFRRFSAERFNRGIETCAFLMGKTEVIMDDSGAVHEYNVVKGLFLPKQDGARDQCCTSADHDPALLAFISEHTGAQQLAWLRSHPTFEAFLSSVDMHMQFELQTLAPLAPALVLNQHGAVHTFMLTEEGMQVVGSCTQGVGFHQHPNQDKLVQEVSFMTSRSLQGWVCDEALVT